MGDYEWDPRATGWSVRREPPLSDFEKAKQARLAELWKLADTEEYRARRSREKCLARMLDLVEGKVTPNGGAE